MRAVVLVGGFGTRLRPLTLTTPKPLLPVAHRPILELVLSNLARGGVTEAVLSLGFKPDAFEAAFPDGTLRRRRGSSTPSSPSRSTPPAPSGSRRPRPASTSA